VDFGFLLLPESVQSTVSFSLEKKIKEIRRKKMGEVLEEIIKK
jgi:hypothetical protein